MKLDVKYKKGAMRIKIALTEGEKIAYYNVKNVARRVYRKLESFLEKQVNKGEY